MNSCSIVVQAAKVGLLAGSGTPSVVLWVEVWHCELRTTESNENPILAKILSKISDVGMSRFSTWWRQHLLHFVFCDQSCQKTQIGRKSCHVGPICVNHLQNGLRMMWEWNIGPGACWCLLLSHWPRHNRAHLTFIMLVTSCVSRIPRFLFSPESFSTNRSWIWNRFSRMSHRWWQNTNETVVQLSLETHIGTTDYEQPHMLW